MTTKLQAPAAAVDSRGTATSRLHHLSSPKVTTTTTTTSSSSTKKRKCFHPYRPHSSSAAASPSPSATCGEHRKQGSHTNATKEEVVLSHFPAPVPAVVHGVLPRGDPPADGPPGGHPPGAQPKAGCGDARPPGHR